MASATSCRAERRDGRAADALRRDPGHPRQHLRRPGRLPEQRGHPTLVGRSGRRATTRRARRCGSAPRSSPACSFPLAPVPPPSIGRVSERQETPAERVLRRSMIDEEGMGRPISDRARQSQRSLEAYLRAGGPAPLDGARDRDRPAAPRASRAGSPRAYRGIREQYGRDEAAFAHRWRATRRPRASRSSTSSSAAQRGIRSSATSRWTCARATTCSSTGAPTGAASSGPRVLEQFPAR